MKSKKVESFIPQQVFRKQGDPVGLFIHCKENGWKFEHQEEMLTPLELYKISMIGFKLNGMSRPPLFQMIWYLICCIFNRVKEHEELNEMVVPSTIGEVKEYTNQMNGVKYKAPSWINDKDQGVE